MSSNNKIITPPHSKESEMMVLGCMLTSINSLNISAEELEENDFYFTEHKIIFQALKTAYKKDKPADIHLISEELKRQDKLKAAGDLAYLTTLAQYAGTSAFIEEYVEQIKTHSIQRSLIEFAEKIKDASLKLEDPSKVILEAQEKIKSFEKRNNIKENFPIQFLDEFDQDFLLVDPPKKPMILEYISEAGAPIGFLPKGIVAMLVGAGGVGKTHLLAQLAISVSTGTPWLDVFTTTKHCGDGKKGNVFLGLGENQYEDIHRVIHKASKKLRKNQPDIPEILGEDLLKAASKRIAAFSFCGQQAAFIENKKPSLYFRQLKMKLIEKAPEGGWSLIILDPVSRFMGADAEIDNAAATQFIALLEELTIDLPGNPTILFAHHVSKAAIQAGEKQNQTAARGASALTDGVRLQINFFKDKDSRILEMTKSNFTAPIDRICIQTEHDGYLKRDRNINASQNSKTSRNEVLVPKRIRLP